MSLEGWIKVILDVIVDQLTQSAIDWGDGL